MTEHEPHHKIVLEESGEMTESMLGKETSAGNYIMPGSIVLAGLLIAAAVFFGDRSLGQALQNMNLQSSQTTAVAPTPSPTPAPAAAPTGPVTISDRSNEPVEGSSNAKVTVVEFGDFQCPFCQSFFQNTLPQIKSNYINTGKVKLIFRHFPLTQIHVNAQISAVAAECANQQGKFWQYHDLLYQNGQADGTNLDKASLEKYADQLGLNAGTLGFGKNKFNQCLEGNATLKIVQADQAEGSKDGVSGTPTFYINGVQLVGAQPYTAFQTALDTALK